LLAAKGMPQARGKPKPPARKEPEPKMAYAELFGAKEREVLATSSLKDDAEFAKTLLEAVPAARQMPKLTALIYEKAHEFGVKLPEGHGAAVQAAQAMIAVEGVDSLHWQRKLLTVYELRWKAAYGAAKRPFGQELVAQAIVVADLLVKNGKANEALPLYLRAQSMAPYYAPDRKAQIGAKILSVREQQKTVREIARHLEALKADPGNLNVREKLICLYVIDLDRPAEAQKHVTPDVSEELRTYVPLAAKDPRQAPPAACPQLGRWYKKLADGTSARTGKANALRRARTYSQRYLRENPSPLEAVKVRLLLKSVDKELAKLGSPGRPAVPQWLGLRHKVGFIKGINLKVSVRGVCFPRRGRLAAIMVDGGLIVWNLQTGKMVNKIRTNLTAVSPVISPDGTTVILGGPSGLDHCIAQVYHLATGRQLSRQKAQAGQLLRAGFVADTPVAVRRTPERGMYEIQPLLNDKAPVRLSVKDCFDINWTPKMTCIYGCSGHGHGHFTAYDPKTGEEIRRFKRPLGDFNGCRRISITADHRLLALKRGNGALFFDAEEGTYLGSVSMPKQDGRQPETTAGALAPSGKYYSGAIKKDCHIVVWDVKTGKIVQQFKGHTQAPVGLSISPDSRFLLSGGDTTARVWGLPQ